MVRADGYIRDAEGVYWLMEHKTTSQIDQEAEYLELDDQPEKIQLLHQLVQDLSDAFPGIETNPNVCGGDACIVSTRIPVWMLEQAHRLRTSEAQILTNYSSLKAEDLVNSWANVRSHREEIERQIEENETT